MNAEEVWLPIPGFEGRYDVSNQGRVRSHLPPRGHVEPHILSLDVGGSGYVLVDLRRDGRYWHRSVHALVAAAFYGPRPDGMDVRHLDGNGLNNALANLAYGTKSQNTYDTVRHGTHNNARKAYCPEGHPYDLGNVLGVENKRRCRACHADRERLRRAAVGDGDMSVRDVLPTPAVHPWKRPGNSRLTCRECGWGPQAKHHSQARLMRSAEERVS